MPLTVTAIRNAKPVDKLRKLTDVQGLYLLLKPDSAKHGYLRYRFESKESKLTFGPYPAVTLSQAGTVAKFHFNIFLWHILSANPKEDTISCGCSPPFFGEIILCNSARCVW
ncbi:Arm DNA-binding domain-containing protein [Buttiauxella selenatireducens]|uniref:Arm DNA-binding domain-containing protein n=1 Tax=Buttiauxella selenatireducens TaxID=3073902 RepID=A0ABY9SJ72_9ENTR|nr:Arm DNA-binding domain-containing protein [Buttiauxella sp. R73]WMY76072.1 Arm DNA-binding domain-containing protein [Buttiauxella sp. R73]